MAHEPLVKDFKQSTSYRAELSWDIELDITDENLAEFETPTQDLPLRGAWSAHLYREENEFAIAIRHGLEGSPGAVGDAVVVELSLQWVDPCGKAQLVHATQLGSAPLPEKKPPPAEHEIYGGVALTVEGSQLERVAEESEGKYDPKTHRLYRFTAILEQGIDEVSKPVIDRQAATLAERTSNLHLEQLPHDVRLFFPHAHADGAELWAKSDFLSRSSPYLKDLLSSDFAESKPRRSKRARTSGTCEVAVAAGEAEEKDYPDSDDETDTFLFSKQPPKLEQSSEADEVSYRQITIKQTAFSTYHAILVYLQTGFIHFTPLASSFPSDDSSSSRNDYLAKSLANKPSLPLPVSPKSAYRLAHLLQLEDLQQRSLNALRSSLSGSNATVELFSPTSIAYDDLRKVILDFVKENWKEVQKSEGWNEKKAAVKAREATLEEAAVFVEVHEVVVES